MIASTMRAAAFAVLLGAGLSPGVSAQQPAPAAPATPAAPAAQFTPSHLAAARDLALHLRIDDPIKEILDEMRAQVVASFTTTRPELKGDLEQVLLSMNPQIAAKREEIIDVGARAFAARFSEAEIGDLLKFLKSPLGAKYLKVQPEAFTEYASQIQRWITSLNDLVITNVRAEMKKKGHDL